MELLKKVLILGGGKMKVIPTKFDNNYISTKLDNVKNRLEEIKENVVVNDM